MTETAEWADALWGEQEGWALVSTATPPDGRDFHDKAFQWPRRRNALLRFIEYRARTQDVWACPLLRSEPRRLTETATLPGRWLWCDLDRVRSWDVATELTRLGAWLVDSGSLGHLHAYLPLAEPQTPEVVEQFNWRLKVALGGDNAWQRNWLLRPPGSTNHKPGGGPVCIASPMPQVGWSVAELDDLLPKGEPPPRQGGESLPDSEPVDWHALPWWLKVTHRPPPNEVRGQDRDRLTWQLMGACVKAGLTDGQVRWMVQNYQPAVDRAAEKDPAWLERTVRLGLPKLRATGGRLQQSHDHSHHSQPGARTR